MKYEVTRLVTKTECHWLDNDIHEGVKVYLYGGCTYGCVSPTGVGVTLERGKKPFFELPRNALKIYS